MTHYMRDLRENCENLTKWSKPVQKKAGGLFRAVTSVTICVVRSVGTFSVQCTARIYQRRRLGLYSI